MSKYVIPLSDWHESSPCAHCVHWQYEDGDAGLMRVCTKRKCPQHSKRRGEEGCDPTLHNLATIYEQSLKGKKRK